MNHKLFFLSTVLSLSLFAQAQTAPPESVEVKIKKLSQHLSKNPDQISTREALGQLYAKQKNYDKVIELLEPYSLELSAKSLLALAEAYRTKQQYLYELKALKSVQALIEAKKESTYLLSDIQALMAAAHYNNKQIPEAIDLYRLALQNKKNNEATYNGLLKIFIETKNNYESRILLQEMIKLFGEKLEYIKQLCSAFTADGFLSDAITQCQKGIDKAPKDADFYLTLAQAYSTQKETQKALETLMHGARRIPQSTEMQVGLGQLYLTEKSWTQSLRYFQAAIKLNDKSADAQLGYAQTQFELKNFEEALKAFTAACTLKDEYLDPFRTAASKLSNENNIKFATRYKSNLYKCKRRLDAL